VGRQNAQDERSVNLAASRRIAGSFVPFYTARLKCRACKSPTYRFEAFRPLELYLCDDAKCIKLAARAVLGESLGGIGSRWKFDRVSGSEPACARQRWETLVLLGRSGSGKTTLLKLTNGLLIPSRGQVLVKQKATTDWDRIRLRRGIGYVIQEAGLFPHFTVTENVALVPTLEGWPRPKIETRVREMLRLVGLDPKEFGGRRPRELSGGQRQRVGVARALAADPPILLMDEPFGALDPVTRAELQREFATLARQLRKTIVFVTHDLREALLLASRIVLLQSGRVVASAPREEFLKLEQAEVRAFAASFLNQAGEPV
jgi:osmoprotectant transport system ATP-binding protein